MHLLNNEPSEDLKLTNGQQLWHENFLELLHLLGKPPILSQKGIRECLEIAVDALVEFLDVEDKLLDIFLLDLLLRLKVNLPFVEEVSVVACQSPHLVHDVVDNQLVQPLHENGSQVFMQEVKVA